MTDVERKYYMNGVEHICYYDNIQIEELRVISGVPDDHELWKTLENGDRLRLVDAPVLVHDGDRFEFLPPGERT